MEYCKWYQILKTSKLNAWEEKEKQKQGNYTTVLKATGFFLLLNRAAANPSKWDRYSKERKILKDSRENNTEEYWAARKMRHTDEPWTQEAVGLGLPCSVMEATSMARRIPVHWSCVPENGISAKKIGKSPQSNYSVFKNVVQQKELQKLSFTQTLITPLCSLQWFHYKFQHSVYTESCQANRASTVCPAGRREGLRESHWPQELS